jgi:two-component system alkaline phosphatase synthesis response regulator PhoP
MTPLILIVDDNKEYREILSDKLISKGYAVKIACDGNEGVVMAKKLLPSLILMDVQMPNKDGISATLDLKQDATTKDIKIIYVTNLGDANPSITNLNRGFAQQIGADNYFRKGGELDILVDKIRQSLQS